MFSPGVLPEVGDARRGPGASALLRLRLPQLSDPRLRLHHVEKEDPMCKTTSEPNPIRWSQIRF